MSLLMDALKKAEQEKNKASEQDEPENEALTAEDLEGVQEQSPVEATDEHRVPATESIVADEDKADLTGTLSLEPITETDQADSTDEFTTPDDPTLEASNEAVDLAVEQLSVTQIDDDKEITGEHDISLEKSDAIDQLDGSEEAPDLDTTFYGTDLVDMEQQGGFEDTLQGETMDSVIEERTYDETLPGVSAVDLISDLGDANQPTPVAAQTVFEASKTTRSSSSLKWSVGILSLVIIGVVLVGIIVYQSQSITPRQLPSPAIARGIEATPPVISPPVTSVTDGTVTGTLIESTPAVVENQATVEVASTVEVSTEPPTVIEITDTESDIEAVQVDEPELRPETGQAAIVESEFEIRPGTDSAPMASLPPEIEVTQSLLKITRSKQVDPAGLNVNEAFSAYQSGDYETAKAQYQSVIEQFPESRDGMLGMAAIHTYEGDYLAALNLYARVIKLDPKNVVANAALVNLTGNSQNNAQESTIKLMLHDNPESSFLYFTLGNLYASQTRWADAQQAFFDAYRNDSTNPNYALNLAIALDRLSQRQAALDYYNTALELADGNLSQFDSAGVLNRISTLNQLIQ